MVNPIIILGAGKLGEVALDIFKSNNVIVYCFLDEDENLHGSEIDDISVLGDVFDDGHLKMIGKKCNAFVAIDELSLKKSITDNLNTRRKVMPVNAIHSETKNSENATIGHGNTIDCGVRVGTKADIANHTIIGVNATIANHSKIGDFVQIGAGSVIGVDVEIAEETFVGSGVTVVAGVKIGKGARIGAGSVVFADVKAKETVFGNPAAPINK